MSTPMSTPLERRDETDLAPKQPRPLRRFFRRPTWERGSMALIALGALLLMQPISIELFGYSFVVMLAGVIGYSIAGKLPG